MITKSVEINGKTFVYQKKDDVWISSFKEKTLFCLPDSAVNDFLKEKPTFITQYLVPDEDFDALRSERHLTFNSSANFLPVSMETLWHIPLDIRLIGQSVGDFLKLFRLEQYEGLAGYGQVFTKKVDEILKKIPPEESEEYELEWRLKDVSHQFTSTLLKTVLQEIKTTLDVRAEHRNEILTREKNLIKLHLELENFLMHQKQTLHDLVNALLHIKDKKWISDLYASSLAMATLYEEIINSKEELSNWPKITLLTNFLENADSWTTYPKERRFLAPFLLKCAFEQIKDRFSKIEQIEAIINFDKKGSNSVVDTLKKTFYQNALLFSTPPEDSLDPRGVYDQGWLSLLPASMDNTPLVVLDDGSNLTLTERGREILNF